MKGGRDGRVLGLSWKLGQHGRSNWRWEHGTMVIKGSGRGGSGTTMGGVVPGPMERAAESVGEVFRLLG